MVLGLKTASRGDISRRELKKDRAGICLVCMQSRYICLNVEVAKFSAFGVFPNDDTSCPNLILNDTHDA